MRLFSATDFSTYKQHEIILDIDGTLVPDGGEVFAGEVINQVRELAEHNTVHLCSNGGREERDKKFAKLTGATWLSSTAGKPSVKVVKNSIPSERPILVIGDKLLTDGLLARRLKKARFIKVKRLSATPESVFSSGRLAEIIDDTLSTILAMVQIIRPIQHIRNLLILAPIFFAGGFFSADIATTAIITLVAFSSLVGFVYIVNDIIDYKSDAEHPAKSRRPLTSGTISKRTAFWEAIALLVLSVALCYLFVPGIGWLLATYGLLNLLYSFSLKHIVILDILLVAGFYIIRILIGGVAFNVPISAWLILTTLFLALLLVVGKRLAEVRGARVRSVTKQYTPRFLEMLLIIATTASLMSYGIYTVLEVASPLAPYTIIPVIYGLFKYLYLLSTTTTTESPERLILRQPDIIIAIIAWLWLMTYTINI